MRRLVALLLAASLVFVSAGSVTAADPPGTYVLDAFSCVVSDMDGNAVPSEVPPGSDIWVFEGWITNTRGQLQSFVNNVIWVLTINGQPADVTPYLSGLMNFGPFWGDVFSYPAGTLDIGDSLQTHYDNVLKASSFDGVFHYQKGSVYDGGVDCTVTVAAE